MFDLTPGGFVARWQCGHWPPALGYTHIASDLVTGAAYLAISGTLLLFLRRRDLPFPRLFWLFAVFIVSCGAVHLLDAVNFYAPLYPLQGAVKAVTAVASAFTAVVLVRTLPHALVLRGPAELEALVAARTTELEAAGRALRQSEERFRAAREGSLHAVYFLTAARDPKGAVTDFVFSDLNRRGAELLGQPPERLLGRRLGEVLPADRAAALAHRYVGVLGTGEPLEEEFSTAGTAGVSAAWVHHMVVRAGDGVAVTAQDISARKRAELALRHSEARFRALFEQSSDAHLIFTEREGILDCNPAAVDMLRGRDKAQVLALHPAELSPEVQPDGRRSLEKYVEIDAAARRDGHHRFDWVHRRLDGDEFPCEVTLTPVEIDGRSALLAVWHDLTERKRAEDAVRASLREKEVLLKEIHHRVKNNLQIICTLLELQADGAEAAVRGPLAESRGRVKSMALIHERLYASGDLARVDFGGYLRRLTEDVVRVQRVGGQIDLRVEVDAPPLPLDVAIPCGLLVNELVTNSLKHAFPDGRAGTVRVSLRGGPGGCELEVADDGVGLPPGLDLSRPRSFGLQIVGTLADQIGGTVNLRAGPGAAVGVRFPL